MTSAGALEIAVIAGCLALFVFGLVLTVRWSSMEVSAPPGPSDERAGTIALRTLWWFALAAGVGLATGVLIIGAGGRLAMRLLAITAGDDAQGAVTEAGEVVGEITFGGTLGFFVFVGLFGGAMSALLYVVLQRWLPRGPYRGLLYGAILLVVLGARIEPLRTNNEDFDLVGPAWVSIVTFALLALAQGAAVASFTARWSQTQPLLTTWRALPRYLPLVPFLLLGVVALVILVVIILAIVAVRLGLAGPRRRRAIDIAGVVLLVAIVVLALPGFVSALTDIAQRG
jgi:hypothetical protein